MKIDVFDDDKINLYLNNAYLGKIDFSNKEAIEEYLKTIFLILKKRLNKEFYGFYNIDIYVNNIYGVIIEINKEKIDFYDYMTNQIEMQVNIETNSDFLFEIDDMFDNNLYLKTTLYLYNDKYYLDIPSDIDINILEYVCIVYGKERDMVKRFGKKLKVNV